MHADRDSRQTSGPVPIGQPKSVGTSITYTSGKFSGKTVRTELEEIQKAKLGRKWVSLPLPQTLFFH